MATVYRSRWRTTRRRLLVGAAVAALVLGGFVIGRLQTDEPAAGAGAVPVTPPPSSSPAAPPPSPSAVAPTGGVDAYAPLQAEDAAGTSGIEMQDTGDEGGGRNAGWINDGDWLRFDEVNFGLTPPARLDARVAAEVPADGGGRLEIRIDSPSAEPVATLVTSNTGGWQTWRTETTDMTPVTGLHTVFVTFASDRPDDFLNVNYIKFAR